MEEQELRKNILKVLIDKKNRQGIVNFNITAFCENHKQEIKKVLSCLEKMKELDKIKVYRSTYGNLKNPDIITISFKGNSD